MAVELASGYVSISPTTKGFGNLLDKQLGPEVDRASRDAGHRAGEGFTSSFGGPLGKIAAVAAGAFASIQVGTFLKDAVTSASSLGETLNKVSVVLGQEALPGLETWAEAAATVFGQSKKQALDAAATFAIFGKSGGLQGEALVGFSKNLTELASDFSSFFDTSPEDAITAIGAALRGESEPIRAYGVLLDEATLKARAASEGIVAAAVDTDKLGNAQEATEKASRKVAEALGKYGAGSVQYADALRDQEQAQSKVAKAVEGTVGQLTPAQRVQAAYAEILAQTTDAQGDFARTSNSLPNLLRKLNAQVENGKAAFGKAFLPAVTSVVEFLVEKGLPGFQKFTGFIKTGLAPPIQAAGRVLKEFAAELDGVGKPVEGFAARLGDAVGRAVNYARLIPAAFNAAFNGGGVTSDGLIGVIERIGEAVRPVVDKIELIPAAFAGAFSGGGVTSDGLIGVIERVGVVTGDLARKLREEIPAAIADFTAGFRDGASGIDQSGVEGKLATVGEKLGDLVKLVKDNPDVFKPIAVGLAGLGAGLVALQAGGGAISLIGSLGGALGGLATALPALISPIGLAVAAVAGLGVAAYVAYKRFVPFRAAVDSVAQTFKAAGFAAAVDEAGVQFGRLWVIVQPKLIEFRDKAVVWVQREGPGILRALGRAAGAAVGFLTTELLVPLGNWITGTALPFLRTKAGEWGAALSDWITTTALPAIAEKLPLIIDAILAWARENQPKFTEAMGRFADAVWKWIEETAIPALNEKLPGIITALVNFFAEHLPEWGKQLGLLFLDQLGRVTVIMLEWVGRLLIELPPKLIELAGRIVADLFGSIAGRVPGELEAIGASILGFFTGLPGQIAAAAVGMWDGIYGSFKSAINLIIRAWNGLDFRLEVPKSVFGIPVPGGGQGVSFKAPHIDELAGGGVFDRDFTGLLRLAETPAARPEIVTPQRLMAETFRKVLVEVGGGRGQAPLAGTLTINEAHSPQQVLSTIDNYWRFKMTGRSER